MIEKAWLTITKRCNLNCSWCYNNKNSNIEMDVSLAFEIIDFLNLLQIKTLIIIGGEPTLYTKLKELLKYSSTKGLETVLVTNGVKLQDLEYLKELKESGLDKINISLKEESVIANMSNYNGKTYYSTIVNVISNIKEQKIPFVCSVLMKRDNIKIFRDWIDKIYVLSETPIQISFCRNIFDINGLKKLTSVLNNDEYIEIFSDYYDDLHRVTAGNIILSNKFPMCQWNPQILDKLYEREQIVFECTILERNGIIFDEFGRILICNFLQNYPIGKFNEDFCDKESFFKFWNSQEIMNIYKKMGALPYYECSTCENIIKCKGGCPLFGFEK